MANITLTDDGTMDTVLRCNDCGEEFRYNYDGAEPGGDSALTDEACEELYDAFVAESIEDATGEHVCANDDDIDTMLASYIDTAIWSSSNDEGSSFQNENFDESDLAYDARAEMRKDCADFLASNRADIGDELASAGHNFWLTRNRHGAGFWDSAEFPGEVGQRLTKASRPYGSSDLYLGDDGKLYVS